LAQWFISGDELVKSLLARTNRRQTTSSYLTGDTEKGESTLGFRFCPSKATAILSMALIFLSCSILFLYSSKRTSISKFENFTQFMIDL
jgi:hypothetical protein